MSMDTKRRPQDHEGGAHIGNVINSIPSKSEIVNLESPRTWAAYRRFARNHRKIARLTAENETLLERMRYYQGGGHAA